MSFPSTSIQFTTLNPFGTNWDETRLFPNWDSYPTDYPLTLSLSGNSLYCFYDINNYGNYHIIYKLGDIVVSDIILSDSSQMKCIYPIAYINTGGILDYGKVYQGYVGTDGNIVTNNNADGLSYWKIDANSNIDFSQVATTGSVQSGFVLVPTSDYCPSITNTCVSPDTAQSFCATTFPSGEYDLSGYLYTGTLEHSFFHLNQNLTNFISGQQSQQVITSENFVIDDIQKSNILDGLVSTFSIIFLLITFVFFAKFIKKTFISTFGK